MIAITAAIVTHNPDVGRLRRVTQALAAQQVVGNWELLVIDNASDNDFAPSLPDWLDNVSYRLIREPQLGLTWARARAIREAQGELIVFVDDDNVLARGYLHSAVRYLDAHRDVSAIGGIIDAEFEAPPADWISDFSDLLAIRDFGPEERVSDDSDEYPKFAPVGAGMVLRRCAARRWLQDLGARAASLPDRRGADLSSSGDNDMIFSCLKAAEQVAYVPSLRLTHLIPKARMTPRYLARLNRGIQKSWVQVLHLNGACPWTAISGWTVPLRKIRAYFRYRAWRRPTQWIRWHGACGHFEGRAELG